MKRFSEFLILIFPCIFLSCAHRSDNRDEYRADIGRIRNNAGQSLVGYEEEFKAKAHSEHQTISNTKKSLYGLNRIQLGCQRKEANYVGAVLFGAIDAADGQVNLDDYTYCAEYNFTNWLKLNWSCPGEETSFIKTKITQVLKKSGGVILLLNDEGVVLQKILILVDQNYDSMDSVPDKVYEKAKRLRVELNQDYLVIERNNWSRAVVLTEKMCQ